MMALGCAIAMKCRIPTEAAHEVTVRLEAIGIKDNGKLAGVRIPLSVLQKTRGIGPKGIRRLAVFLNRFDALIFVD